MDELIKRWRHGLANDATTTTLKLMIIAVALLFIGLALSVENKWVLAGAFLYMILP